MIDDHGNKLFEWVSALPGGYVNSKQQVRRDPKTGVRGVYVSEDVREGEILATVPWNGLIAPQSTGDKSFCDTIVATARELAYVAANSEGRHPRSPYAELLYATRDGLPNFSNDAVSLLTDIVGRHLPPRPDRINPHLNLWKNACGGNKAAPAISNDPAHNLELYEHAALLVQSRADWVTGSLPGERKAVMVPIFDLFNHRNGKYNNMRTEGYIGCEYKIIASKDINAGEQVYNTYGNRGTWVTFNNFGFVEDYPQRWTFDLPPRYGGGSIDFILTKEEEKAVIRGAQSDNKENASIDDSDISQSALQVHVLWNGSPPSGDGMKFLARELDRLNAVKRRTSISTYAVDPTSRHVLRYHIALIDAISEAIRAAGGNYSLSGAGNTLTWLLAGVATLVFAAILGRTFLSTSLRTATGTRKGIQNCGKKSKPVRNRKKSGAKKKKR